MGLDLKIISVFKLYIRYTYFTCSAPYSWNNCYQNVKLETKIQSYFSLISIIFTSLITFGNCINIFLKLSKNENNASISSFSSSLDEMLIFTAPFYLFYSICCINVWIYRNELLTTLNQWIAHLGEEPNKKTEVDQKIVYYVLKIIYISSNFFIPLAFGLVYLKQCRIHVLSTAGFTHWICQMDDSHWILRGVLFFIQLIYFINVDSAAILYSLTLFPYVILSVDMFKRVKKKMHKQSENFDLRTTIQWHRKLQLLNINVYESSGPIFLSAVMSTFTTTFLMAFSTILPTKRRSVFSLIFYLNSISMYCFVFGIGIKTTCFLNNYSQDLLESILRYHIQFWSYRETKRLVKSCNVISLRMAGFGALRKETYLNALQEILSSAVNIAILRAN